MWDKRLAIYDALIEKVPDIKRKGKTVPYTSDNGYMFSQLNKAGEIGIRLPKDKQKEFMALHPTTPFKSYGATMKDYLLIPDDLFHDLYYLAQWLKIGHEYVCSLPPK